MGKNKDQGTWWESFIRDTFIAAGRFSRRLEEGGKNDLGDVYVEGHHGFGKEDVRVALAWRRFLPTKGKRRRTQHVVVLHFDDFVELAKQAHYAWIIEAKASQAESVTTVLAKAQRKVDENWDKYAALL